MRYAASLCTISARGSIRSLLILMSSLCRQRLGCWCWAAGAEHAILMLFEVVFVPQLTGMRRARAKLAVVLRWLLQMSGNSLAVSSAAGLGKSLTNARCTAYSCWGTCLEVTVPVADHVEVHAGVPGRARFQLIEEICHHLQPQSQSRCDHDDTGWLLLYGDIGKNVHCTCRANVLSASAGAGALLYVMLDLSICRAEARCLALVPWPLDSSQCRNTAAWDGPESGRALASRATWPSGA